ncbi:Protein of unknown function [Pyronema omphalodes CBS 100304]|uniref:Uncharacterized protein n=1 Tax=Pyronema omphalodes (strain CBS 100304) TaxID=1076935 RepID=U4L6H4_PYROM|nr:Protein of unknown function [Pyronema omphalodes CBS 100304]
MLYVLHCMQTHYACGARTSTPLIVHQKRDEPEQFYKKIQSG